MRTIAGLKVLGSGTSSSTPTLRCRMNPKGPCAQCQDAMKFPETSKNKRNNPSLLVWTTNSSSSSASSKNENNSDNENNNNDAFSIIIDVGKTFRDSALRVDWKEYPPVKCTLLTHFHADAINGLDDIREFSRFPFNCYCDEFTKKVVERREPHLTKSSKFMRYVGSLNLQAISSCLQKPVEFDVFPSSNFSSTTVGGKQNEETTTKPFLPLKVTSCPLFHGEDCTALGFHFPLAVDNNNNNNANNNNDIKQNGLVYFSDVGRIDENLDSATTEMSKNAEVLFLDCIGKSNKFIHGKHLVLEEAVRAARLLKPKKCFLTGIGHMDDHDVLSMQVKKELEKDGIEASCAYDGMEMRF